MHLAGVATTTGVTAQHIAKKFGFAYATTDYREILQDAAIGSVLITTRHNLHGRLVVEALGRRQARLCGKAFVPDRGGIAGD